jgi:hypothetical protein
MERKEFLLKSCAFCGCAGLTMLTGQSVKASAGVSALCRNGLRIWSTS